MEYHTKADTKLDGKIIIKDTHIHKAAVKPWLSDGKAAVNSTHAQQCRPPKIGVLCKVWADFY